MRTLLSIGVVAVAIGTTTPASAQMMCSPGQGTDAQGGMMCGGGTTGQAPAQNPNATQANPQAQAMGGCPCCRNMASMMGSGAQRGGSMNMPGHSIPGMETPKPQ
jgi:hypothetical protein